ncbi:MULTISPECIES: hypothetical protein [Bradyrhizobium]|uniref:Uncharacterized protein n=1 Tax=Bradyrhizobium guangdongense TaxID=1325090 RepID=A0AA87W7L3_9BRAD|nr:hypothetical protein GCM10010987_44620 [Bradyrhizobium guangdongense]
METAAARYANKIGVKRHSKGPQSYTYHESEGNAVRRGPAALDPETKKEDLVTIRDLAAEGMTCILDTYEMGFAREVADHGYCTDGGVIVKHGAPSSILGTPREERTRVFLDKVLG